MSDKVERIPFDIDISRVIEVLARQIYQSPLALLRENVQNAYDAILIRLHAGVEFEPLIDLRISPDEVRVTDNGVGMTIQDLRNHYWRAGSSSKNNSSARAAGVIGTFGIGAMANFGIASELTIITEDIETGQRTLSRASREALSVKEDCIDLVSQPTTGKPGTEIIAKILPQHQVNVAEATRYITGFVAFLQIPVYVNGVLVSQGSLDEAVPRLREAWRVTKLAETIGGRLKADIDLIGAATGEMWLSLRQVEWDGGLLPGKFLFRQGTSAIKTYRSGFGLATVSVTSAYHFGGVADFLFLEPTAGREALATASMQTLQAMIGEVDAYCSRQIATRPESDTNTAFMGWVTQQGLYELCGNLKLKLQPVVPLRLQDIAERTATAPMLMYNGTDQSIISHHASEDTPLLLVAQSQPRRQCEFEFLRRYCQIEEISNEPVVLFEKPGTDWSLSESALAFRIASLLETDYFLKGRVVFGRITHGLPILVQRLPDSILVTLDPAGPTVSLILTLYENDFGAFGSLVKDFVRNAIFPKISDLVPSSTRQGAEAFLKTIRRTREIFEYETSDLRDLPSIWQDVLEGRLTVEQATEKSIFIARASVQVIDSSAAAQISGGRA